VALMNDLFRTILSLAFLFFALTDLHADDELPIPSSRLEAQSKTVKVFANLLYWRASETVDWAFTLSFNQNSLETAYKTFSFNWDPGFRIGLGYNMEHDQWDTQVSYTWFQSKATSRTSGAVTPAFLAARLSLLEPFSIGKASLDLHYNMFDWDLGRSFLVSNYLSVRTSIGLRGGWINQTIHSDWITPDFLFIFTLSASENLEQRFKGGGPKGGISGKWSFGKNQNHSFSLISQFETGYLWGHWSIQDKYVDNLATVIRVITSDRNFGALVLHSEMGFAWDYNFNCDRSHFNMTLSYTIEDWLNHCQIFTDASGSQDNDLILQGLNLGLSLDF